MVELIVFLVALALGPVLVILWWGLHELTKRYKKTVLFICTANAGRSQMSAAYFNKHYGASARAVSAGAAPVPRVHPDVLEVMRGQGLSHWLTKPRKETRSLWDEADCIVIECEYEGPMDLEDPSYADRILDWSRVCDPRGKTVEQVKEIYDDIVTRIENELLPRCFERPPDDSEPEDRTRATPESVT